MAGTAQPKDIVLYSFQDLTLLPTEFSTQRYSTHYSYVSSILSCLLSMIPVSFTEVCSAFPNRLGATHTHLSMIFILAAVVSFAVGGLFLVVLKRALSGLESKQEELAYHLDFYDLDDGVRDTKELMKKRKERYLELVENYYNLTTDLLHMIWGPHYSMGMVFPVENKRWQTYAASQQMYQCYLGASLDADENSVLGDFGCGTGGPTRCIAQVCVLCNVLILTSAINLTSLLSAYSFSSQELRSKQSILPSTT